MNACQSASTTGSSTANFAHQLASQGVPYVLGMAFKVTHTAVEIFTSALHDYLLWDTRNILLAVYEARAKLRANKERTSDLFGLPISLHDDILPVLYASGRQLHKHSMNLLKTSCETPSGVSTTSDNLFAGTRYASSREFIIKESCLYRVWASRNRQAIVGKQLEQMAP